MQLSGTYTLVINNALAITSGAPPAGYAGTAYSFQFTVTGGVGPYVWSANGLPAGLSLSAGGLLSGTPSSAGSFSATITVTDANG